MIPSLYGKVAVVTGASAGIGNAIAVAFAKQQAHVVCCARDTVRLGNLVGELQESGAKASAVRMDIRNVDSVQQGITAIGAEFGVIDVLVNNAGGAERFGGIEDLKDSDWLDAYDLNLLGPVRVTREALPLLRKSEDGRVINLSSLTGLQPGGYNPHYASAKAALINFGKYLANALAKDRILVTTVCPGPIQSDAWDRNIRHVAEVRDIDLEEARETVQREEAAKVPIGRIGVGEDIAGLVTFLAGKGASFMTGTCIVVDGGKYRSAF